MPITNYDDDSIVWWLRQWDIMEIVFSAPGAEKIKSFLRPMNPAQ
jgi:hypothetical protein